MEDDWIIASLKSYEILHTFELPQPTHAFDWSNDGNGGNSLESNNEILELSVPEKILNPNNGLSSKRDFTLQRGGFSSAPICSLKHLNTLHKLATVGYGDVVKIYSLDCYEKGVIQHLNDLRTQEPSLNCLCHLCWNESHPSAVLCGSTTKTAALLDIEKDKILYQCDSTPTFAPLNGLLFAIDSYKFITLSNNGSLELWDPRMKALAMHFDNKNDLTASYSDTVNYAIDVCGNSCEDTKLTCVSRQEKQVAFYELRQWKKPFASILLDHGPQTSNNKHLCVKFSPHNDKLLSISGLSKGVGVYKMDLPLKIDLVFTHFGHEAEMADTLVLTHSWHPKMPKLLVSTSSDGSLHVWQWKEDQITK